MTDASAIPEVVADVMDEVADTATEMADISREASGRAFGWGFTGLLIGLGAGAAGGYFFAKRQLEDAMHAEVDEEVARVTEEMRAHYQAKAAAQENTETKASVADIIHKQNYATPVSPPTDEPQMGAPVGVAPPAAVVAAAEEARKAEAEQAEAAAAMQTRNIFTDTPDQETWDWDRERKMREKLHESSPYIVHADERQATDFEEHTLTYYVADDVLCDEADNVIDPQDRDGMVGESNLDRFGHGSGDPNIVYVRHDEDERQYEIVRSEKSYVEEVIGIEPNPESRRRRQRSSPDDD